MKKIPALAAVAAAAALTLTACGSGDQAGGDAATGGNAALTIGNFADVVSWDPANADIGFDGPYLSAVYDPLVTLDDAGAPAPALATKWEVAPDRKSATLDLRAGVTFSDGSAFDAAAAVKNLEHLKSGTRSKDAYTAVKGFSVVDTDTIKIELNRRDDTLLYFMGLGRSWMASPQAIDAGTLDAKPVGSGPYTLADSSVAGSVYHFDKVADQWNAAEFKGDPLSIQYIQDATARNNAMGAGQINVNYADTSAIAMAKDMGWNEAHSVATWVGLQFSGRAGTGTSEGAKAIAKLEVRQAINHAFDGAKLLATIGEGAGEATNQTFPVGTPGYDEALNDRYAFSIETAKKLLAQAGYPDGFALSMPITAAFQPLQPSVEQAFKEIGIKVTWDNMQYADYQGKVGTYPVFLARLAMYSDPIANVVRGVQTPMWYNPEPGLDTMPEVKAQVDKVLGADPAQQPAEVVKLNGLLTEKAYFNVWYQGNNTYVSAPNITVKPLTGQMFPTLNRIDVK